MRNAKLTTLALATNATAGAAAAQVSDALDVCISYDGAYRTRSASYGVSEGNSICMVELSGDRLIIKDRGCEFNATRRGPILSLSENSACGCAKLSFSGLYVRGR